MTHLYDYGLVPRRMDNIRYIQIHPTPSMDPYEDHLVIFHPLHKILMETQPIVHCKTVVPTCANMIRALKTGKLVHIITVFSLHSSSYCHITFLQLA